MVSLVKNAGHDVPPELEKALGVALCRFLDEISAEVVVR